MAVLEAELGAVSWLGGIGIDRGELNSARNR